MTQILGTGTLMKIYIFKKVRVYLYFMWKTVVVYLKQLLHFIYSSAKNYAWYRPDVQCMFEEVSFNKALFSHLVAM